MEIRPLYHFIVDIKKLLESVVVFDIVQHLEVLVLQKFEVEWFLLDFLSDAVWTGWRLEGFTDCVQDVGCVVLDVLLVGLEVEEEFVEDFWVGALDLKVGEREVGGLVLNAHGDAVEAARQLVHLLLFNNLLQAQLLVFQDCFKQLRFEPELLFEAVRD